RKRDHDPRATVVGEIGGNGTAVQLGYATADIQPEPEAGPVVVRVARRISTEKAGPTIWGYADPVIAHDDLDELAGRRAGAHLDRAAVRTVPDGVVKQAREDLLDAVGVEHGLDRRLHV